MKIADTLFLLLATLGLPAAADAFSFCSIDSATGTTRYDELFQPTCHNCYEIGIARKMGANTFQEVLGKVKTVELDIWDNRDKATGAVKGEWFVRHGAGSLLKSGNDNNCTGNGSGKNNLSACLGDIRDWSNANPGHPVVTLFLDKKQNWSSASGSRRRPADLDKLIADILGARLYRPNELRHLDRGKTLRDAAKAGNWPTQDALKGRVIVVLTGGDGNMNHYVAETGKDGALFVAPNTNGAGDITGRPGGFSDTTAAEVVFYNIKYSESAARLATTTRANRYIARVWGADGAPACNLVADCVNANALDDWDKGSCSATGRGKLARQDSADPGWQPQQAESRSNFACPAGTVMTGRWHDCRNKGNKCDENGDSSVLCRAPPQGLQVGTAAAWQPQPALVESAGTRFECAANALMTARRHDCGNKGTKCDENGTTQYQCAGLVHGAQPAVLPSPQAWSSDMTESTGRFVCPEGQALDGRVHRGDENGPTAYRCVAFPAR